MRDVLSGLVDVELSAAALRNTDAASRRHLRQAILNGALLPGHRLPSSREFARQIKVSRNTVTSVIDQLAMEGYLDMARGRRPVVATQQPTLARARPISTHAKAALRLSQWARRVQRADWPFISEGPPRPFQPGVGDAREFPHELWARYLRRAARGATARAPLLISRPTLQSALLRHLATHRGVRAEARQLVIVPSAQAAIELIARVVLDAGDEA